MSGDAKRDNKTKPDLSMIPNCFEIAVARVMQHGADKYGRSNYLRGHTITGLVASARRHIGRILDGEDIDDESGESHWAHVAANMLMAIHQQKIGTLKDDRYKQPLPEIPKESATNPPTPFWELWASGGSGPDCRLGAYPTKRNAEIMLGIYTPDWPTFTLYIKEVHDDKESGY